MPRRKNKSSRGRKTPVRYTQDHVRREPFSTLKSNTGAISLGINPANLGTRVAALADLYEMYRVVRLRVRFHPPATPRTGDGAICYVPGVTDTAPSSYINICETQSHLVFAKAMIQPSRWLELSKATLSSYETWYKTIVGTPDPAQEVQGNLYYNASAASDPTLIEMEGVIEFRAPAEAGATPAMRRAKLLRDEYVRMQTVLTEGSKAMASLRALPPPT